jgi:NADH dehydrogenase
MRDASLAVVTGAFGYSGRYMAERLLAGGVRVRTITGSPNRPHGFGERIEVAPLAFDDPAALTESLRGASVLINTYWVRFNHELFQHSTAVDNTLRLLECAQAAGVGRIVHVSITNPSADSPFEYFRGKARLEEAVRGTGIPYTILRPAALFGGDDILVNNIAWMLRRLPVFGVFGDGEYGLQPIHVEDFAHLAVRAASATGSEVIDAIGPETFTYKGLAQAISREIGVWRPMLPVPPRAGYAVATLLGRVLNDQVLTWEEIGGLMAGLLRTDSPPAGQRKLTEWARANRDTLGRTYASELRRRKDRQAAYGGAR